MSFYPSVIRPWLFKIDAERVHDATISAAAVAGGVPGLPALVRRLSAFTDEALACEVCGLQFPNPIGLAAGYDKNGKAVDLMAALGFGFIEIGSVSAHPSDGNPKPRLWRLPRDRAIIVNYGLPNHGADSIAARLETKRLPVPLGVNIVKTNRLRADPDDAVLDDYVRSVRTLEAVADYLTLNLSCPNTETGRDFFGDPAMVARLLEMLAELDLSRPLFLKVSPLGGVQAIEGLLEAVDGVPFVSGFIFNLPPGKPAQLDMTQEQLDRMPGAVAGKPIETIINDAIGNLYQRMDQDRYHIIAAGGIFTAEDAYRKVRIGASLVQVLTGLVFEGPGLLKRLNRGLCTLLQRDGFTNITQAVGAEFR